MGDGEDTQQHRSEDGKDTQEGQRGEEGSDKDLGTKAKDECLLAMPPAELDESGPACDASVEQPAAESEPQEAEGAGSAAESAAPAPISEAAHEAASKQDPAAETAAASIQAHPVADLRPMTAAPPKAYPMVNPLAETILTPPQTAPAAPGQLDNFSRPPTRGSLSRPHRGFRGRFITRQGRVLSPSEMAGAVERLSNTVHNIADLQLMLAQYAHLPKQKTCLGKEFITPEEMEAMVERLYAQHPAKGLEHKGRPKPVKMTFRTENGQQIASLEPLPVKDPKESTEFLCELYQRCRDAQAKSRQALTDKYLQPLVKPKIYSGPDAKKKIMEVAQKLYTGESTR